MVCLLGREGRGRLLEESLQYAGGLGQEIALELLGCERELFLGILERLLLS